MLYWGPDPVDASLQVSRQDMQKMYKYKIFTQTVKERNAYIVYSPALDLSAYGSSVEEAKQNFHDTVKIFLREAEKKGNLEELLVEFGWEKVEEDNKHHWNPPQFITNDVEDILLPA